MKKTKPLIIEYQTKLEIYPNELGKMTWDKAIEAVEKLGDGWRLPTILDFQIIYNSDLKDKFKTDAFYWSSTEYDYYYAWFIYFNSGFAYYYFKDYTAYVRAVRNI